MNPAALAYSITGFLTPVDLLIVVLAVAFLLVISYVFGREEKDTRDFFLGNRQVPAFVACLSFVATEVSALTIVAVPATAYSENWHYLQFFIGSAAARLMVAVLFLPVFYQYNCTTIYEFLRHRFGPATQYTGSIFFFITRLIASAVRLYAACLGIALILGWNLGQTLFLFTAISIVFIAFGGIKAVVWAGAYQALTFLAAAAVLVGYLLFQMKAELPAAWQLAQQAGRLSVFNFAFNLNDPTTFWAGTANAFFIGLAVFGTDQEMVQRLLTVKTRRTSQKTMIFTIAGALPVLLLYLAIGTLLYVFYQLHPEVLAPDRPKEVLSHFVAHSLPGGLKGLMLSAIILAGIDSPLSSLSSSFITDIYRPLIKPNGSESHFLLVSRGGIVGFGILLALLAWACDPVENILWFAFQIFSLTGGASLGVFLLGVLTRSKGNRANVVAMVSSTAAMTALLLLSYYGLIRLAWSWLIVLGTAATFLLGYALMFISARWPLSARPQ